MVVLTIIQGTEGVPSWPFHLGKNNTGWSERQFFKVRKFMLTMIFWYKSENVTYMHLCMYALSICKSFCDDVS